jgi:hypothetical protein
VLLIGTKLSAPKRLLQLTRRQNELETALAILQSVAPIDVTSSADGADADSGFSSVVELGAPSTPCACPHLLTMPARGFAFGMFAPP